MRPQIYSESMNRMYYKEMLPGFSMLRCMSRHWMTARLAFQSTGQNAFYEVLL